MSVTNERDASPESDKPPLVLIAGAGLGGLFLGILLERANIPYEIFERSKEMRPLGK
jgi:2-polyprenyl-6-methoxyphenol hydroxylase-like FAD-dependent oxidoreductase